jgi:hypothetical protein
MFDFRIPAPVVRRDHSRVLFIAFAVFLCASCSKTIGWGVLLWYTDDPPMPSGTVLRVMVRSNIENMWIAQVPEAYRGREKEIVQIPLEHLELVGNKAAAEKRAAALGTYKRTFAETMQDGLPVRDQPGNTGRRVYRLRMGEVVKILERVEGPPAVSTTGAPLPGEWFHVLTENGSDGYCFSYRLKLFEHESGPMVQTKRDIDVSADTDLDIILSRAWHPERYAAMIESGKLNLEALSRHWRFDSGTESGTARVFYAGADLSFPYTRIRKEGAHTWIFDGSPLKVTLQSETSLVVQYEDTNGQAQSVLFVTLPENLETVIRRENERRGALFQAIYVNGPSFHSVNYGTITFSSDQRFTWEGIWNIPPGMLSQTALPSGRVNMNRYLEQPLDASYTGALVLVFDTVSGPNDALTFLYSLENQGIRMEYVPPEHMHENTVFRAGAASPVIYFSAGLPY